MYRRIKLFTTAFIFLLFFSCQANTVLDEAQTLFKNKEYQQAAELYEKIEPKNGAIWHNLGHCYAQQHDQYRALICWRKAQKNAYGQQFLQIKHLIQAAEQELGITHPEEQIKHFLSVLKNYCLAVPLVLWQVIFLFLWYLVLYLLLRRKQLKAIVSIFLIFFLGFTSGGLVMHYNTATMRSAIVNDTDVPVYAGTDERFSHKMVMAKGQHVTIKESENSWRKIECETCSGWVCANKLEELV